MLKTKFCLHRRISPAWETLMEFTFYDDVYTRDEALATLLFLKFKNVY
jgi:hypothetical protein